MRPLLIFRHIACEGPGYLAEVLERNDVPCELIRIDAGEPVPAGIGDASGLVFMGGPMSVNDSLAWISPEMALIREAAAADLPVLGHCLGGQLISKALGGAVTKNPVKEIGWHAVRPADGPVASEWLRDIQWPQELFHWHGETFSLPEGAQPLLQSEHCPHQGFVIGNTLALQCHIEMTAELVRTWTQEYQDELQSPSETVQSPEEITRDLEERIPRLQRVADVLYARWLRPLLTA